MDTLGTLIDKQSILMIRRACAKDDGAKAILDRLIGRCRDEINQHYYHAIAGLVDDIDTIIQPKFKNYANQDNVVPVETKMGTAIQNLMEANITLWDIEDERRDKSKPDAERLALADQVSEFNKKRNDAIDQIDHILWDKVGPKWDVETMDAGGCATGDHCCKGHHD